MLEETQALMGATRLASGIFQQPRPALEKCSCYLMELVSILFMFVVLAHFPGSGAASFFCRNVENVILFARFLLPFVLLPMSLNIKALVRFLCMPYRLWLKIYFKKSA